MRTKDFLYLCISKGIAILPYTNHAQTLNNYKSLAEHFNYPCEFKDGKCIEYKESAKCCCHNCAFSIGHLRNIRIPVFRELKLISKYARLFDIEDGFWRENKGCILPYKMRSITCIIYMCDYRKFKILNGSDISNFITLLDKFNYASENQKQKLHHLYLRIRSKKEKI